MALKPRQVAHGIAAHGSRLTPDSDAFLPGVPVGPPWSYHPLGERPVPVLRKGPKWLLGHHSISPSYLPTSLSKPREVNSNDHKGCMHTSLFTSASVPADSRTIHEQPTNILLPTWMFTAVHSPAWIPALLNNFWFPRLP